MEKYRRRNPLNHVLHRLIQKSAVVHFSAPQQFTVEVKCNLLCHWIRRKTSQKQQCKTCTEAQCISQLNANRDEHKIETTGRGTAAFYSKPPPLPRGDRTGLSDDLLSCSAGKYGPERTLWAYPWPDLTSDDPKQMTVHYCGLQRSLFAILEVYQRGGASLRCVYSCLCDNTVQECGLSVLGICSLLFIVSIFCTWLTVTYGTTRRWTGRGRDFCSTLCNYWRVSWGTKQWTLREVWRDLYHFYADGKMTEEHTCGSFVVKWKAQW